MAPEKKYTSQLGAGLGMISETLELLRLWEPGQTATQLADRAIDIGLFSRTTARRSRNLTIEMFAPRYLTDGGLPAARLKLLMDRGFPYEALVQLFFMQTARAHQIFADFVVDVYWAKYSAGASFLNKENARSFISMALDGGIIQKRWSDRVVDNTSGYLIGCCIDFGLLAEGKKTERPIRRFSIRNDVALYLAHDLHFAGFSDMGVVQHHDWRLFGLEVEDVIRLMKSLSHDGHLVIQSSGELVQVSWKYRSMEECLDAITQR